MDRDWRTQLGATLGIWAWTLFVCFKAHRALRDEGELAPLLHIVPREGPEAERHTWKEARRTVEPAPGGPRWGKATTWTTDMMETVTEFIHNQPCGASLSWNVRSTPSQMKIT